MSRSRMFLLLAAGILGYALYGWLFARFSSATRWNVQLGPEETIRRAREVAAQHGFDVRGWASRTGAEANSRLDRAQLFAGFRDPQHEDEWIGVRLDANGRPTAVVVQRARKPADDVTVEEARPLADRAFRAFVPNANEYRLVAQEDLGDRGVRFQWERPGESADFEDRARVVVAGNTIRDVRFDRVLSAAGDKKMDDRPIEFLDTTSDIAMIVSVAFGLLLYVVFVSRGLIPRRLGLTFAGAGWLLLLVSMWSELDPALQGIFGNSSGNTRWALLVGSAILAIPSGLSTVGAYPSLRRLYPAQLLSLEELVLRGRMSRRVGAAIVTGIACGGWIDSIPHLLRATGLFGTYLIDDGVDDALFRSALLPGSVFASILLAMVSFALLYTFAHDKLRGWLGILLGYTLAFAVLVDDAAEPIAAALIAGAVLAAIYGQILQRADLLALIAAAASSAWASVVATLFVQPSHGIQNSGLIAMSGGLVMTAGALAVSRWGSTRPYRAWEPRPPRAERERIQTEFSVASTAQQQMLPARAPELPGIAISAVCQPAKHVGGDLYDFIAMKDGKLGVGVADVSGKGVPAALIMTITKGLLLAATDERSDPLLPLTEVNAGIHSLGHRNVFVTMLFGVLDPSESTFEFVRAGHTALIRRTASGEVETLSPRGIGIGMTSPRNFAALCERRTVTLSPGEFLVLYSDGVSEAMNVASEEFGDERLVATVRDRISISTTADAARDAIIREVAAFRGDAPVHDDLTIVVIKRE